MNKKDSKKKISEKKGSSKSNEIGALKKERDEAQEKYLRIAAEFQNFKKRQEEERKNIFGLASASIILKLFGVIDNFERALEHAPKHIEKDEWFSGIKNTKKEFDAFLKEQKIEPFGKVGDNFDPNLHEALFSEKGKKDKIVKVIEIGIKSEGKVIRTAKVSVGNGE